MAATEPHPDVVASLADNMGEGSLPVGTLSMMWFIEAETGERRFCWRLDGDVDVATVIGHSTMVAHAVAHLAMELDFHP